MIIGLTGPIGSGKGEVANILKEKGFQHLILSDRIKEEMEKSGLPKTRENLQKVANEMRAMYGHNILAKRTIDLINSKNVIIEGIRSMGEVELLKNIEDFILVSVEAPIRTRYERTQKRKRSDDKNKSYQEFAKKSNFEIKNNVPGGQEIGLCMKAADVIILNNKSLKILKEKVNKFLEDLELNKIKAMRLSWDQYFLKIALVVAERSTCLRHSVGAITVKNKRILSTGYNGAASGIRDCIELGCLRNTLGIPSGEKHEICRAIHAEQNAIIQAALHGINLKGATMYCTHTPCIICAKMIVNAGIKKVVTFSQYNDTSFKALFKEAGVEFERIEMPSQKIKFRE